MTEAATTKHSILVVDDEEGILRAIKRVLRRAGYSVDIVTDGNRAIELLKENAYAVIICDQRMPDMPGAEVLAQAYKIAPDTYRITLTGYTDLTSAQNSINKGRVQQFLTKPWDDESLLAIVETGVAGYEMICENRRLTEQAEEHKRVLEGWNSVLEQNVEQRTADLQRQADSLQDLSKRLKLTLRDTVELIVGILDAADAFVAAHSRRVATLAVGVANAMGLDEEQTREIEYVALLHDVGKVAKLHTQGGPRKARPGKAPIYETGHTLLSRVRGFEPIAEAVRCMAARYDGAGEPNLREDSIPLAARIVAAANAFDTAAFSPSQPTKPRVQDGLKAVEAGYGKAFDPDIVTALRESTADSGSVEAQEVELSTKKLRAGMVVAQDVKNAQGVLMLSAGTELSGATIAKLCELAQAQVLTRGVYVHCEPDTDPESEPENTEAA